MHPGENSQPEKNQKALRLAQKYKISLTTTMQILDSYQL